MKNRTTLIFSFLLIIIILLSFFLYRTQKKFNAYTDKVKVCSGIFISSYSLQSKIEDIEKLRSDTTEDYRNFVYEDISVRDGITSAVGYRLFALVAELHSNEKNKKEINKLIEIYGKQTSDIRWLLYKHRNFNDMTKKDIDTLISYYKTVKKVTEQIENMKIEP